MDGLYLSTAQAPALAVQPKRLRLGLLAAGLLHGGALLALCVAIPSRHPAAPDPPATMSVVFAPAPQAVPEQPQQTLADRQMPVPVVDTPADLAPLRAMQLPGDIHVPPPHLRPRPAPRLAAAKPVSVPQAEAPTAPVQKPPAQKTPAAKPQPAEMAGGAAAAHYLGAWEARIRQAVQDAAVYPGSARLLRRQGKVQVQFDYNKGEVGHAAVVRTSSMTALDQAALAAVTHAAMPAPPPELGPQTRTMVVWVEFTLVAED